MVDIIAKGHKKTFLQTDKGLQGYERGLRVLQGLAQLGTVLGWNGKMIAPLGKTLNLTRIADRCLDARMAILALEIVKDLGRFNYHMMFSDARGTEVDGTTTQTRRFLTSGNTFGVACLVLDLSLASSFLTNQVPLLPKGVVTHALSTALQPTIVMVFVMGYAQSYQASRDKELKPEMQENAQRDCHKCALDLMATLVPLLLPNLGGVWQSPLFNVTTGAFGAYVIWQNFPASKA